MRLALFFILSFFSFSFASASGPSYAFGVHHGFLLPHHAAMKGLQVQHLQMAEAELGFPFFSEPNAKAMYHHPQTSLVFSYAGLGNPEVLGNAFSLVPSIHFNHSNLKRFRFGFKGGFGLAYLPKVFSVNSNYRNISLSNNLNAAVLLRYGFDYFFGKHLALSAGIGFSHFSNGSFAVPNLGVNLVSAYGRISLNQPHQPYRYDHECRDSLRKNFVSHRKWVLTAAGALKEVYPVLSAKFPVFAAQMACRHYTSPKGAWITALGIYFDQSLRHHLLNDENPNNDDIIIWQAGLEGGYLFSIHRLELPIQIGVYVFDQYKRSGTLYSRLGLRYRMSDRWSCGVTLKTHYFKASFFDLGLSYVL
jgi:hypothetical protein